MPAKAPSLTRKADKMLRELGQRLRDHRKHQGISAEATAEAAGVSRVTLYRVEKGESSVAMSAYMNVILALGLELDVRSAQRSNSNRRAPDRKFPSKIRLNKYKQLKQLAWQLKGVQEISPQDALDLYERNWRHVDFKSMDLREREFLQSLLDAFGRERLLV